MRTRVSQRWPAGLLACLMSSSLLLAGCASRHASLGDAFPIGSMAAPWNLSGQIWSGSLEEALPALGGDADQWRDPPAVRVWLAVYCRDSDSADRLIARAFELESDAAARSMYERIRPVAAPEFRAGNAGCWSSDGVLFVWGRFVFDIFAAQPGWPRQLQAAMLAQHIQKQMPPGLPEAPP